MCKPATDTLSEERIPEARRMDERRKRNAPVGVPCWKLVEEGRTR